MTINTFFNIPDFSIKRFIPIHSLPQINAKNGLILVTTIITVATAILSGIAQNYLIMTLASASSGFSLYALCKQEKSAADLQELEQATSELKKNKNSLVKAEDTIQSLIKTHEKNISAFKSENRSLERNNEGLKKQVTNFGQKVQQLETTATRLQEENTTAATTERALREQVNQVETHLTQETELLNTLRAENTRLTSNLETSASEIETLHQTNIQLEANIRRLEEAAHTMTQEFVTTMQGAQQQTVANIQAAQALVIDEARQAETHVDQVLEVLNRVGSQANVITQATDERIRNVRSMFDAIALARQLGHHTNQLVAAHDLLQRSQTLNNETAELDAGNQIIRDQIRRLTQSSLEPTYV